MSSISSEDVVMLKASATATLSRGDANLGDGVTTSNNMRIPNRVTGS
jgi:hypothetical protein